MYKAIIRRFSKAFIAGFVSSAGLITVSDISTWTDLGNALQLLTVAGIVGGVNGILMAVDKFIRWSK